MSSSLMVMPQGTQDKIVFSNEQIALIRSLVAKDATPHELELFLYQCKRTGLDPLAKQIYFQKYLDKKTGESKMTIITSIDGYRLIADRTGSYAGNDEPLFGEEKEIITKDGKIFVPSRAVCTVWKIVQGLRVSFSSTPAYWDEYYPGEYKGHMWRKMPHVMLAKCAEAAALRKAFPNDLSGIYIQEEMEQAQGDIITVIPEPKKQPSSNSMAVTTNEPTETQNALAQLRVILVGNSNKEQSTEEQQANMKTMLVKAFGDGNGKKIVSFLTTATECHKVAELNAGEIIALLQWFGATESNGYTPSPDKAKLAKQIAG